jgi:predicted permease
MGALATILPIFVLVALGFAAGKLKLFDQAAFRAIGRFVMLFALPATIFNAVATRRLSANLDLNYLAAYGLGSLAVLFASLAFFAAVRRRTSSQSAILALGASASNTGFIGYPVALQALGPAAGVAAGLSFLVENLLVIPLALFLAERAAGDRRRALAEAFRRVLALPLVWAVLAGFAFAALGVALPEPVQRPIAFLAGASAPAALFFVGGVLSALEPRAVRVDSVLLSVAKLVLHPLLVFALLALWPTRDPALTSAALILASAPVITIYPLLGQPFGMQEENSVYLMISTLIAAATLPVVLVQIGS